MPRPTPATIELAPLHFRAEVRAESVDADARTAEVVWSTGAPVQRVDWMTGQRYIETLSLDPKHVRLERLNSGAPLLDAHNSFELRDVIGVVEPGTARVEGGKGTATVRFSQRDERTEGIWRDVRDGIIRNVSIGYRVHKYEQTEGSEKSLPRRHAIDWEPFEISAVPVGADPRAGFRGDAKPETNPCVLIARATEKERAMPRKPVQTPAGDAPAETPAESVIETRLEPDPEDPGAPLEPTEVRREADTPNERDQGAQAERERVQGIRRAIRAARLSQDFEDRLIADGVSLVDAQTRIFAELEKAERVGPRTVVTRVDVGDPNANVWRGIENALLHRAMPEAFKLDDNGRLYRGLSLLEVARLCLAARGVRTTGMSKMDLAGKALGLDTRGGMHTTSDFANILADVANKTLRAAYQAAPQTFTVFARRVTLPDFKMVNRLQLGEAPQLQAVGEHGEYTRGTIGEGKEQFQLATYGRIFSITRKALVNDDTNAFARITTLFGQAARNLESDLVWQQITSNPVMGDGTTLFHADHGNLAAAGAAIAVDSLGTGRAAMRVQTGLDGQTLLNISPRFLAVPAALETKADQFVSTNLVASQSTSVNPFAGRLQVIAEPRLDANSLTAWYLIATADQIDTLEYAYLEGEEGPVVETRVGFDVDGLEVKARHDFAAKVIDHRGFYKNPGA